MSDLKDPRVLFAAERTLLAWNRTCLALIGFGFLIERAGMLMQAVLPHESSQIKQGMSFWLGMAFILFGAVVALYSSYQYKKVLRTLNPAEFPENYGTHLGVLVSWLVAILSIALMVVLYLSRV